MGRCVRICVMVTTFSLAAAVLLFFPVFAMAPLSAAGCDDTNRVLMYRSPVMNGRDIQELQLRLKQLGLYSGPAHGSYDRQTEQAVRAFQAMHKLDADGMVGSFTWEALSSDMVPVATKKGPPPGKVEILIDVDRLTLTVLSDGEPYKTYPVAIGKDESPTPVGEWRVIHKGNDWGGGFGTRWLGLNVPWGIYGIHGTNKAWSIGTTASGGCIRMFNEHVEELFPWINIGDRVRIKGKVKYFPWHEHRTIKQGASGQDVVVVQMRLQSFGLYWGLADGLYGPMTVNSVKYFQLLNGLPDTGTINSAVYKALGLQPAGPEDAPKG